MIEEATYEVSVTLTFKATVLFDPIERATPLTTADAISNFYGMGLHEVIHSGEYVTELRELVITGNKTA